MGCNCYNNTLVLPILSKLSEEQWVQAFLFFVLMLSLFMGIAIIADIFMTSIEIITSSTKKIYRRKAESIELEMTEIPIWNKTVANLTLMSLGSSAPEILLATIETIGNGFVTNLFNLSVSNYHQYLGGIWPILPLAHPIVLL